MAVAQLTVQELSHQLGEEIPEVWVVLAKHEVLGFDESTICDLLGIATGEFAELKGSQTYRNLLLILKSEHARTTVDRDLDYDSIEAMALTKIKERLPFERDMDTLMRVATMANRANKSTSQSGVLDPRTAAVRVPITLSSRMVRKLHADGTQEEGIERTINTLANPTFEDVDGFLHVSAKPFADKATQARVPHVQDPSVDDLLTKLASRCK